MKVRVGGPQQAVPAQPRARNLAEEVKLVDQLDALPMRQSEMVHDQSGHPDSAVVATPKRSETGTGSASP